MRICGCLIVKNEEKNLPRCLESLQGLTDSLVIADTGSNDQTRRIAMQAGALVLDFPWQNDFAAARNFVLEQAQGDWIVFLDADEYFLKQDAENLKQILGQIDSNREFDSCLMRIYNIKENNQLESIHNSIRIFRNLPQMRFRYSIHETLFHSNHSPHPYFIEDRLARIMHTGYADSVKPDKIKRNLVYLQQESNRKDGNPLAKYYLAESYLLLGNKPAGIALAREFYQSGFKAYKNDLAADLLLIKALFYQTGKHAEILEICNKALLKHPAHPQLIKSIADYYFLIKDYNLAEIHYKLSIQANQDYLTTNEEVNNFPSEICIVYYNLALISLSKNHIAVAEKYLVQALNHNHWDQLSANLYLEVLKNRKYSEAKIISLLTPFYRPENCTEADFIIPLLVRHRIGDTAIYFISSSGKKQQYPSEILLFLILKNELKEVLELFTSQPEITADSNFAYLATLLIMSGNADLDSFSRFMPSKFIKIINCTDLSALDQDFDLFCTLCADLVCAGVKFDHFESRYPNNKKELVILTEYIKKRSKTCVNS